MIILHTSQEGEMRKSATHRRRIRCKTRKAGTAFPLWPERKRNGIPGSPWRSCRKTAAGLWTPGTGCTWKPFTAFTPRFWKRCSACCKSMAWKRWSGALPLWPTVPFCWAEANTRGSRSPSAGCWIRIILPGCWAESMRISRKKWFVLQERLQEVHRFGWRVSVKKGKPCCAQQGCNILCYKGMD